MSPLSNGGKSAKRGKSAKLDKSASKRGRGGGNRKKDDDDDESDGGSLSSLSFYDDFPDLYFAVRRGRYVNNSVFLSWDSARRQIVDFPEAEYIATPTLHEAHRYANGFLLAPPQSRSTTEAVPFGGHSSEEEWHSASSSLAALEKEKAPPLETQRIVPPPARRAKSAEVAQTKESHGTSMPAETEKTVLPTASSNPQDNGSKKTSPVANDKIVPSHVLSGPTEKPRHKKKNSTRSLLLEYYRLYDPCYKDKGKEALTVHDFLQGRNMSGIKKHFLKHWQRSGLLIMRNEEKSLEDATRKYDTWIANRNFERYQRNGGVVEKSETDEIKGNQKNGNNDSPASKKRKNKSAGTPSPPAKKPATKVKSQKKSIEPDIPKSLLQSATIDSSVRARNTSEDEDDDEDYDEGWNKMYQKLRRFHAKEGHCRVTKEHDAALCHWVRYNKRRMRPELCRSGARGLSLREEKLLFDLDFDETYQKICAEFSQYLGMRIVKLFHVPVDETRVRSGEAAPEFQYKPFFGTVGRISSFCNRYLRIRYDDGDSEDVDKCGLIEGLKLYQKYKHLDTESDVATDTPPVFETLSAPATVTPPPAGDCADVGNGKKIAKAGKHLKRNALETKKRPGNVGEAATGNGTRASMSASMDCDDNDPPSNLLFSEYDKLELQEIERNNARLEALDLLTSNESSRVKDGSSSKGRHPIVSKSNKKTDDRSEGGNDKDDNGSDGTSSSDEVEIVEVLTPYRAPPDYMC